MPDGLHAAGGRAAVLTLPNVISLARLCLVPAMVWLLLRERFAAAFWLFGMAALSDAADGWLARRRGPSALGALLDPVADKVMLVSLYVALAATRVLPDWLAILVVFRDLLIVGGVLVLSVLGHGVAIRPLAVSKLNTALQIVLVLAALLQAGFALPGRPVLPPPLLAALAWLVAASTTASGAAYVLQGMRPR